MSPIGDPCPEDSGGCVNAGTPHSVTGWCTPGGTPVIVVYTLECDPVALTVVGIFNAETGVPVAGPIRPCGERDWEVTQWCDVDEFGQVISAYIVIFGWDEVTQTLTASTTLPDGVTPYTPTGTQEVCSETGGGGGGCCSQVEPVCFMNEGVERGWVIITMNGAGDILTTTYYNLNWVPVVPEFVVECPENNPDVPIFEPICYELVTEVEPEAFVTTIEHGWIQLMVDEDGNVIATYYYDAAFEPLEFVPVIVECPVACCAQLVMACFETEDAPYQGWILVSVDEFGEVTTVYLDANFNPLFIPPVVVPCTELYKSFAVLVAFGNFGVGEPDGDTWTITAGVQSFTLIVKEADPTNRVEFTSGIITRTIEQPGYSMSASVITLKDVDLTANLITIKGIGTAKFDVIWTKK